MMQLTWSIGIHEEKADPFLPAGKAYGRECYSIAHFYNAVMLVITCLWPCQEAKGHWDKGK